MKYWVGQKQVYSNFFFFTGIVNDGRELKYRTKKQLNLKVKLTKCQYLRRTINTIPYTVYLLLAHLVYAKNSRINLDRLQNKYTKYKGIKNNTSSGQITGVQEKLDTKCK
jgi:hypothetical protein